MIRMSTYFSIALFGLVTGACDAEMPVASEASAHTADGSVAATQAGPPNDPETERTGQTTGEEGAENALLDPETTDFYPLPDDQNHPSQAAGDEGEADEDEPSELTGVVNLNEASLETLQLLPGIGPAIAERIGEYRTKRRFEKPDHIMRVKGIGEATFADLREYLSVEGATTLEE